MLGNTRLGLLLILALVLAACRPAEGTAATPTITSEDVLMTAEAIAEATRNAVPPTASPTPVTPTATAVRRTVGRTPPSPRPRR